MIGERSTEAPRKDRLRRGLLLLLLLLVPFALGGISVGWLRGTPEAGPPGTSFMASATASQSGESPGASQVALTPPPTPPPSPLPSASGGGAGSAQLGDAGFTISGSVGNLSPGVATPIRLTLTNPNGVPIYVTALTVTLAPDSTPPGCSSASNLQVTQSNASGADPIVIAANSSMTLVAAPRAPQIRLLNLPGVNQDICKNKSFALTYSGSAHS